MLKGRESIDSSTEGCKAKKKEFTVIKSAKLLHYHLIFGSFEYFLIYCPFRTGKMNQWALNCVCLLNTALFKFSFLCGISVPYLEIF